MKDIAQRAGVHRATVSNVLNGKFKAERSDAARRAAKIRKIAAEMGYRPATFARATRTGETGLVGMIKSPSLADSVHAPEFEAGVIETLHANGLCLLLDVIDDSPKDAPRILRERVVNGMLINYVSRTPQPVRDILDRCDVPAIWINRKLETHCVRPNDEGAAREATRHLLAHGHRHVACIVPQPTTDAGMHYSMADRQAGYEYVMRQAGLTPQTITLHPDYESFRNDHGGILRRAVEFLSRPNRPTAILGNVDGPALLLAAASLGISVPEDLSVMAFDNQASMGQVMTYDRVLVPYKGMGRAAVMELLNLIDRPDAPRPAVLIPFDFQRMGTVVRPTV
jgi:LacI family transcriptional regulator